MIEIYVTFSPNAEAVLSHMQDHAGLGKEVCDAMDKQNELTVEDIKRRISGPGVGRTSRKTGQTVAKAGEYVGVNTGTLRRSIGRTKALWLAAGTGEGTGLEVASSIGSGTKFTDETGAPCKPCEYAAIHEFGGDINHPSRPRKNQSGTASRVGAALLRSGGGHLFRSGVKKLFPNVAMTKSYKQTLPERSYVRRTIRDRAENYSKAMSAAVVRWWRAMK